MSAPRPADGLVAPSLAPVATDDTAGHTRADVLADRDVVDDHALRRGRLRGTLARGSAWRVRREARLLRHLLVGALIGLVALFVVGATSFVQTQLARQGRGPAFGPAAPAASPSPPVPGGRSLPGTPAPGPPTPWGAAPAPNPAWPAPGPGPTSPAPVPGWPPAAPATPAPAPAPGGVVPRGDEGPAPPGGAPTEQPYPPAPPTVTAPYPVPPP